jgi:hypothetical protein
MALPKISLASLQCPRCAGLTTLTGLARTDSNERFSFECNACGAFEVLTIAEPQDEAAGQPARRERELQDLWA